MQTQNTDWNPALYLKYGKERIQPTVDLVKRIASEAPKAPLSILDVGCGPGNSTAVLRENFPNARISGLDSSPAMIEQARENGIKADWILADVRVADLTGGYDLIFSNAAYQWMKNQPELFKRLRGDLKGGGIFAGQIPLFGEMPMSLIIEETNRLESWTFKAKTDRLIMHSREEYYDILSGLYDHVELWVTDYVHVMESADAILDMMRSTALKPYLSQLDNGDDRKAYEREILKGIERDYPPRTNGSVLYPFKRLFFIAK